MSTAYKHRKKSRRLDHTKSVVRHNADGREQKALTYSLPERPINSGYNSKVINGSDKSRRKVFKTQAAKCTSPYCSNTTG